MTEAQVSDDTLAEKSSPHDRAKEASPANSATEPKKEHEEVDIEKNDEHEEDESQYPSTKVVAIVMLALYLAMYLVALVCCSFDMTMDYPLKASVGQNHYLNGCPNHYRQIRFSRRCWLVWICLPAYSM